MDPSEVSPADGGFRANVWKTYVFRSLFLLHFYGPIWVIYLRDTRGFSLSQITLVDATFFIAALAAEVPTGALADRFGRRVSVASGCALWAAAMTVLGVAASYPLALAASVGWGVSVSLLSGADQALLYDSLKQAGAEEDYARVRGREVFLGSAAIVVATLAGAPLAAATSMPVPLFATAAAGLLAGGVVLTMREPPRESVEREPYARVLVNGLRDVWERPAVARIIVYGGMLWACAYVPLFFVQPFLTDHGVGVGALGLWQAPLRLAGMLAAIAAYRVVAVTGRNTAFAAMPLVMAAAYLLVAGVDHIAVYAALMLPRMIDGIQGPTVDAYVNERIPDARRATVLSAKSFVLSLASAGFLQTGGFIADAAGLRGVFLAGVAASAVTALAYVWWSGAERRAAGEPAAAPAAEGQLPAG